MTMKGDSSASIAFLKKWAPKGPWLLTAIPVDQKGIDTKVFGPNSEAACLSWLDKYNGSHNLYFSVNRPNNGHLKKDSIKKTNKEDIQHAEWLHVDIDTDVVPIRNEDGTYDSTPVDEEIDRILSTLTDRIPKGILKPTCIVFSGNGLWGFWKLEKPFLIDGKESNWEELESYNIRLSQIFGGDNCHNVDRIARLPGTVNIPNAKKRKMGRVEKLAELLSWEPKNEYEIGEFKKSAPAQSSSGPSRDSGGTNIGVDIPGNVRKIEDLSELDEWDVPDRVKVIVAQGHHPDQPKEKDNSRSSWVFDCCCSLLRCKVPDEVIFSILTDKEWGIAESVVELKSGAQRYAIRQIKRAKEFSEDPKLVNMNDRHAIIGNIGGKCRVIEEVHDPILDRYRVTMSSFEDIRNRYSNQMVKVGTTKEGQDQFKKLGDWWLGSPNRRQYSTMRFMPDREVEDVYNLWRGFAFEPIPGDCSLYLKHLQDNICNGNVEYFEYLIKWMARAIQEPASQGEVAIVLHGGKGTGKGTFAGMFGKLFGRHHLQVANPSHLVGNFNAHLRDVICLFADEAFFAGDKRHESVLKMLVTEDSIPIEAKGYDVEPAPNYVHMIMASNDLHVIRASGDERRYFVLKMGEGVKQDKAFFSALRKQMDNGGYEALLHHLQSVDISEFQVRDVPSTDALQEQKMLSLGIDEEWWIKKLRDGRLQEFHTEWDGIISCKHLTKDFIDYADTWKFTRRGNETMLGKFLSRVAPHLTKKQVRGKEKTERGDYEDTRYYAYNFGSLKQCREAWDHHFGKYDWPEIEDLPRDEEPAGDVPF